MTDFNYQKAYCVQALPAFKNLPEHVKKAHKKLLPLVGELQQGRNLEIPLNDKIRAIFDKLPILEIAQLSRASYFVGHWHPGILPSPFEKKRGESWKVSNCADQVLRERLQPPPRIEIHEGKLRVTYSSRDCWLWEEFALATEKNLQTFKESNLPFGESTLLKSAEKLAEHIGDLWPDVDSMKDNELYKEFVALANQRTEDKNREKVADLLKDARASAKREIETAKIKTEAYTWLLDNGFTDLDNVIYYNHTKTFCFGWRNSLSDKEKSKLLDILCEFPFEYETK